MAKASHPVKKWHGKPLNLGRAHLKDYFRILLHRWWILVIFFVVTVASATVLSFMLPPEYQAVSSIRIFKEAPKALSFEGTTDTSVIQDTSFYRSEVAILKSQQLAKEVVDGLHLELHPEFSKLRGNPTAEEDKSNYQSRLIDAVLSKTDVRLQPNTQLVQVMGYAASSELAAQMANALVDAYIRYHVVNSSAVAQASVIELSKKLEEVKAKLERSELALHDYAKEYNMVVRKDKETEQEDMILTRLGKLNAFLTEAEASRIAKEALYVQILNHGPESSLEIQKNPLVMRLKEETSILQAEYDKLLERVTPEHPEARRLKAKLAGLKNETDTQVKVLASAIHSDYLTALESEKSLRQQYQDLKRESLALEEQAIPYLVLRREVKANRVLYDALLERIKKANTSIGIAPVTIQIVDRAGIPKTPHKPNKRLNILLSVLTGLVLGTGLVFVFEYFDTSVKSVDDLEGLGIHCLGVIQKMPVKKKQDRQKCIITHVQPKSPLAEAFRMVKLGLVSAFPKKTPIVCTVTSVFPYEGKTVTSMNLSIVFAQDGYKVLLADADLRRLGIQRLLQLGSTPGFSDFLSEKATLEEVVRYAEIANLDIIPGGSRLENPSQALLSTKMDEFLRWVRERYEIVIIDSSPLSVVADTQLYLPKVDGCILVVHSSRTDVKAILHSKEELETMGINLIGAVLNKANLSRSGYYDGKYSYYYHSYYGKEALAGEEPLKF